jgi:hypothetical protein
VPTPKPRGGHVTMIHNFELSKFSEIAALAMSTRLGFAAG